MPTKWLARARAILRRSRMDDELAEEIRDHIELRRQALVDDGVDAREAERRARAMFGNVTLIREQSRDVWGIRWLDTLTQDVRYGGRLLRRSPGFTAMAVLSLAIGIGSAAAVFNIADAVLFRTLAVSAPHELRQFSAVMSQGPARKEIDRLTDAALRDMQDAAPFAAFLGFRTLDDVTVATAEGPRTLRVELASDTYFDVLDVRMAAGRGLTAADAGAVPIPIVISERLWTGSFARDSAIAGRPAVLNGIPSIIVGVAHGFQGLLAERPADVIAPAAAGAHLDPVTNSANLRVLVRLPSGLAPEVAEARLAAVYERIPNSLLRAGEIRVSLHDARGGASDLRRSLTRPLTVGLALVGVMLLLASANAAGLLLARFSARQHEFGVRIAIGAGRARLARQLVVEALLLAALAAAAALVATGVAAPLLLASMPVDAVPPEFELRYDWRLAAFVAVVSGAAAVLAAAASLFRLVRSDAAGSLRPGGRGVVRGRGRLAGWLIGAQVACSLLLLVAAGSIAQSLVNLRRVDPGFDPRGIVTLSVETARSRDDPTVPAYFSRVHERLAELPQVSRVSFAQVGLMTRGATTGTVDIPGWSPAADADRWVRMFWVGPDFFETVGMRVIAGTGIAARDAAGRERVAVVNDAFARFYFGSAGHAVGRTVNGNVRILGVVNDARYSTLRDEPVRALFLPHTQAPTRTAITFVVRPAGDPGLASASAVAALRAFDPDLKVRSARLDDLITATLARERFVAALGGTLSILALLLSCAGLYASVANAAAQRRSELAVRVALGASGRQIVGLMLRQPVAVTAAGIAAGIPGAYVITRALSALLFGVPPLDVPTLVLCAGALIGVAAAAAWRPARRAAAVDPIECLKFG